MKNSSHSQNVKMSYLLKREPFIGSLHCYFQSYHLMLLVTPPGAHTTRSRLQNVSTMGRDGHALPGGQNLVLIIANGVRENSQAVLCKCIRHSSTADDPGFGIMVTMQRNTTQRMK